MAELVLKRKNGIGHTLCFINMGIQPFNQNEDISGFDGSNLADSIK